MSVQKLFVFGRRCSNFGPLVATKWLKVGQNGSSNHYLEKCSHNPFQTWSVHQNFGPLVATKWMKIVVSDHYLQNYSCNPIQTWCVHLLSECSELIRLWATMTKFWSSSGRKITESDVFRQLSEKVWTQSNRNLVCALIRWMFRIVRFWATLAIFVALYWPQNYWKWWFPIFIWKSTIIWNNDYSIYFKHGGHIGWMSLHEWFHFLLHRPNLAPMVAISVLPFPLVRLQAGTCILWCIVMIRIYRLSMPSVWFSSYTQR